MENERRLKDAFPIGVVIVQGQRRCPRLGIGVIRCHRRKIHAQYYMRALRTGHSASPSIIGEFALRAYHCSPQLFEALVHLPVAWHAPR